MKQKLSRAQENLEQAEKELLLLRAERYELKNEIKELKEASIEMQSRESDNRLEDDERLQMEIHKYKKKADNYDMKLAEVEDRHQGEIMSKCDAIKALEEEVANLKNACSRLESDLEATREQGLEVENNLNEDIKLCKTKFEELLSENISNKSKLNEKVKELDGVRSLCETAETKAKQYKFDGEQVKKDLERKLQQTLTDKSNELEALTKKHELYVQNMQVENKNYIKELKQNYELAAKDLNDSFNEANVERDDLKQKVEILGLKFEEAQQKLKAAADVEKERLLASSESKDETKELVDLVSSLEEKLDVANKGCLELNNQIESLKNEAIECEKNKKALEDALKELTEKHDEKEQSVKKLSQDLLEEKNKVENLEFEKSNVSEKLDDQNSSKINKELEESKQKVSELERYVEKFETDHDNLVKQLKCEIEKLKSKTSNQSNGKIYFKLC